MGINFNRFKSWVKKVSTAPVKVAAKDKEEENEELLISSLALDAKNLLYDLHQSMDARPAASKESRKAAREISSLFSRYVDDNDVTITSSRIYTSVSKGVFISLLIVSPLSFLLLLFNMPLLSFTLILAWSIAVILQIKGKKNIFKMLMPSDESANVHAVIEPEELVEQTIIFSAHHDSGIENKVHGFFSLRNFSLFFFPLIGILLFLGISVYMVIRNILHSTWSLSVQPWPIVLLSIVGVALTYSTLLYMKNLGCDYINGAGDDLAGVSVVVQLLRYFSARKKSGKGLRHTRLIFTSFDGEECNAQGSDAWYKSNARLLIDARNLNINGLYKADDLVLMTMDGNGVVPLSSVVAKRCSSIAFSLGYKIPLGRIALLAGTTDALSAAKNGVKATTLTSMKLDVKTPAHTKDDTPDVVELDALSAAISVAIKYAESEDEAFEMRKESDNVSFLDQDKKYKLTK